MKKIILSLIITLQTTQADETDKPVAIEVEQKLEYKMLPFEYAYAGPKHTRYKYEDGLWISVIPLVDTSVQSYFGAYPSLINFAKSLHEDIISEAPLKSNNASRPGFNSAEYIFGQQRRHKFLNFKGHSYMAQYTQGPGDHSLKNEDLSFSLYGIIYSEKNKKKFIIKAGMGIAHKELNTKRQEVSGSNENSPAEIKALNSLALEGFSPSIQSVTDRLKAVIKKLNL